jgi:hypothetical protein
MLRGLDVKYVERTYRVEYLPTLTYLRRLNYSRSRNHSQAITENSLRPNAKCNVDRIRALVSRIKRKRNLGYLGIICD